MLTLRACWCAIGAVLVLSGCDPEGGGPIGHVTKTRGTGFDGGGSFFAGVLTLFVLVLIVGVCYWTLSRRSMRHKA
jgi:hypothetical protein